MAQQNKGVFFRLSVEEQEALARKAKAVGGYPALIRKYVLSAGAAASAQAHDELAAAVQSHRQREARWGEETRLARIESVLLALLRQAEQRLGPADYVQWMLALEAISRLLMDIRERHAGSDI